MTDDDIIEIRDELLETDSEVGDLTVIQRNILRDCEIALRMVECEDKTAAEARGRLVRYRTEGAC